MSLLEKLPAEIFREIVCSLAFFDQRALSTTSKKCHALTGTIKSPDELSKIVSLCRYPSVKMDDEKNPLRRGREVQRLLLRMRQLLSFEEEPDNPLFKSILLPYFFDKPYPMTTIAHFYLATINDFAKWAVAVLEAKASNDDEEQWRPSLELCARAWREIEGQSRCFFEWFEH